MAPQSPLAMLVLVTPYTILYLVNQLLLNGVLDRMHYVFFELIFVLAFQKIFGIPDLSERLFPAQVPIQAAEAVLPVKTIAVGASTAEGGPKKKVKKVVRKSSSTGTVVKKAKEQPYAKELAAMEKKLTDYLENTEIWEKIYEEDVRGKIEVYQYKARPMCYKIISVMSNTPESTFDLLCDVARRVEWDPLCVEAKTVADIAPGIKVQYVRTKAMWPTSSRDTLVLGTVKRLADGRYMNVTSSVEHHLMPERTKESIVRMDTALAGQIVGPEPGQPEKSRLIQVLDTDLKGWIPDKIIQLVSTKAVPGGIRKVNKILRSTQSYTESKTMENYAKALKAAEEAAEQQGEDAEGEDAGGETSHELASKSNPASTTSTSSVPDPTTTNGKLYGQGTIERKRPSTFRIFWEGFKQNLGYGRTPSKANKALVAALVLAVLGPAFARFRRSRK
ncbi:StAR- lipid transfer protein 5 [Mortierella sp. AD094]|nr:StAR- lipid transfer protein 5 [Mortierella sp. AD094]